MTTEGFEDWLIHRPVGEVLYLEEVLGQAVRYTVAGSAGLVGRRPARFGV